MVPEFFQFHNPTKVIYGPGIVSDLKAEIDGIGVGKYLVVSDRVIDENGLVGIVEKGLGNAGVDVVGRFLDVPANAEIKSVYRLAEMFRETNAEGFIAVGGGSVMDAAKAANILVCEGGNLLEDHSGVHLLTRKLKPLIAVPTTSGTGSEVTMVAMVYDAENQVKIPFTDKFLLPDLAVLDPEMTMTMPKGVTASTAMDALTHAIEAFVGPEASPISDALAAGAVQLIFTYIEKATADGNDIEARGGLQTAATMAGIAFTHSMVGCVHAMAHAVGGIFHVPHGVANAILLPHGMEYNFNEIREKLLRIAPAMGINISGASVDDGAREVISAVRDLLHRLNEMGAIPLRLREVGVDPERLQEVADAAVMDGSSWFNPREMTPEEILPHLKNAY